MDRHEWTDEHGITTVAAVDDDGPYLREMTGTDSILAGSPAAAAEILRLAEEVERLKRERARAREQLVAWERNLAGWPMPHRLAMRSAIDRCVPEEG